MVEDELAAKWHSKENWPNYLDICESKFEDSI
uniref:Uncharacterized protein n=1 Tax=Rhizophora mucronata TaxID=61149 RepID=A0A2P2QSH0_RHIMU